MSRRPPFHRCVLAGLMSLVVACCFVQRESATGPPPAGAAVVGSAVPWLRQIDALERVPAAVPENLRGYGALAIRQGRGLYIADGDAVPKASFRRVERGRVVRAMSWSYDGRWLAYAADDALWLVARSGSTPRRLALALRAGDRFAWSPRADVLWAGALAPNRGGATASRRRTVFEPGTLALVTAAGDVRRLPALAVPDDVRWSASGRRIVTYAFAGTLPSSTLQAARQALFTAVPQAPVVLASARVRVASNPGAQVTLAARVPRSNDILYWHGSQVSASLAADGQELRLQPASGAAARTVGFMLENRGWISFAPDATQFVFVQGGGREAWHGKSLVVCGRASAHCLPLAAPPDSLAVDPQWSPRDARIAFVHARDVGAEGGYGRDSNAFLRNWVARRVLWLQSSDGTQVRPLERFGKGIYWPRWSHDGRRMMVYRDGEIWLGGLGRTLPKRIVSGLVRPAEFGGGYFAQNHGSVSDDDDPVAWTGG